MPQALLVALTEITITTPLSHKALISNQETPAYECPTSPYLKRKVLWVP